MKNKGQITVLFSCMISILLVFTLTAIEVGRIYCGRMKLRAVIHSAQSSILADYNRELFERYHLLFMDPTYGTGSSAMVEEKFSDYLKASLEGDGRLGGLYSLCVEETALSDCKTIMDDHMKQLKNQITDYEKEEGVVSKLAEAGKQMAGASKEVLEASDKTERNAIEIPQSEDKEDGEMTGENDSDSSNGDKAENDVEDPRDKLKQMLSQGVLVLLLPEGSEISEEKQDFSKSPSHIYSETEEKEKDADFQDVSKLVSVLNSSAKEEDLLTKAGQKAAFTAYVMDHFSSQGDYKDSVMHCEAEYIIKGKACDKDNLEAVLSEIIWMRMPINYICLIKDPEKQTEALTVATAICSATGTMALVEIVKYLLLGCWSYAESVYEVRQLMHGEKLPYIKTPVDWNTDLKSLSKTGENSFPDTGMSYKDYLCLMLAAKESKDLTYARMLDLIEKNLQVKDENLSVVNLCGAFTIQGKIRQMPMLVKGGNDGAYDFYYQEEFSYDIR